MKNKKGFTLIELLAVIVILAIIALIAVPVILNILDKSNKSAFKDTAYGIISAGELYFAEKQLEITGMGEEKIFDLSQKNEELQLKGQIPSGTLKVNQKGETALAIQNGRYCITKEYTDNDITVSEDLNNCKLADNSIKLSDVVVESTESCLTSGVCELGTEFKIQVNDSQSYDFKVMNDTGSKATLVMSEPLGDAVAWNSEQICERYYDEGLDEEFETCVGDNTKGPLTLLQALEDRTATWTKLPEMTISTFDYDDGRIVALGNNEKFETHARLPRFDELADISGDGCDLPDWYWYHPMGSYYWTSTVSTKTISDGDYPEGGAWYSDLNCLMVRDVSNPIWFLPVIELTK